MAIYQNKEVSIDAYPEYSFTNQKFKVTFQDGTVAAVDAGQLQMTEDEKKVYDKRIKDSFLNSPTVDDQKVKEVRKDREKSVKELGEPAPFRTNKVK